MYSQNRILPLIVAGPLVITMGVFWRALLLFLLTRPTSRRVSDPLSGRCRDGDPFLCLAG